MDIVFYFVRLWKIRLIYMAAIFTKTIIYIIFEREICMSCGKSILHYLVSPSIRQFLVFIKMIFILYSSA
ncbi:hypothetical protein CXU10_08275 [Akkermansia muciniphila]|nr:hypothetical protein CXU10_08275 [Akkermansia muciniphila]